ncbi:ankyrin repeat domain-containing protein [Maridesulfovibrio sp.]|uniref:ankyrin repeat domain-containing protein n=1 Tax=Maridesulfovibrio sp. TaxID=2795000 RepID=UPI003BACB508
MNKKWTIATIGTVAFIVLSLILAVNIVVDPYGEYRIVEAPFNKLKFKAQKTSALQVASKLYDDEYTLIFGSSRTMLISEDILGEPVLNFSTSIYNNPGDILALLETLDEKQIKNIKQIYYLIDINSFHYQNSAPELASKLALFMESFRNIGPQKIEDAWQCITENLGPESDKPNYIDEFGVLNKEEAPYKDKKPFFSSHYVTSYYLDKLTEINSFCKKNSIPTIYFTIPWIKPFAENQSFFLKKIMRKIPTTQIDFYDFYLNTDITGNKNLFTDPSHLNAKGLKKIFTPPYWTKDRIRHANNAQSPNIDFTTIRNSEFSSYVIENFAALDASIFNQMSDSKRPDLILAMYDTPLSKKKLVSDCFLLGQTSLLKELLSNGRSFNTDQDTIDLCLLQAIMSGNIELIKAAILLGADVNSIANKGEPPLSTATRATKGTYIVKFLLENGANENYINKKNTLNQALAHSVYTLALLKGDMEKLTFFINNSNDSPLSRHAKLLLELEKNPDNATAYAECTKLQNKHYNVDNIATARFFISDPDQCYIKKENGLDLLVLPEGTHQISSITASLFKNIKVKKRFIDIADTVFSEKIRTQDMTPAERQKRFSTLVTTLHNLVLYLEKQKILKRLN